MQDIDTILKIINGYKRAKTDVERINLETVLFNMINGKLKYPFLQMLVSDYAEAARLQSELDELSIRYREVVQQRNDFYNQVQEKKKARRLGPQIAPKVVQSVPQLAESDESATSTPQIKKIDPVMKLTLKDPDRLIKLLNDAVGDEKMELTPEIENKCRLPDHGTGKESTNLKDYEYTTMSKNKFCEVIELLKEHLTRSQVVSLLCNVSVNDAREYRFNNIRNLISSKWHSASLQYVEPYGWVAIQIRTGWLQKKIAEECK